MRVDLSHQIGVMIKRLEWFVKCLEGSLLSPCGFELVLREYLDNYHQREGK